MDLVATKRIAHLNAVLRGIRNVNQLITRERDSETLVRKAAEALVDARGYSAVALVCDHGAGKRQAVVRGAEPARMTPYERMLAGGGLPACLDQALRDGEIVVRSAPWKQCPGCPVNDEWHGPCSAIAVPVRWEERRFGGLVVSLPEGIAEDPEELELLDEVACDLGYGLHNIEVETALRESEHKYRLVTENVSDVIWVFDTTTMRVVYLSPSVERLRGYTVDEVLAQGFLGALTPASAEHFARVLPERIEAFRRGVDRTYTDEIEQPCKDGSAVLTEGGTHFVVGEDGHTLLYGVTRDITDRRRALRERLELEGRYRSLFEQAAVGVAQVDAQGRFAHVNQRCCDIVGYTRDELLGASFQSITHPDEVPDDRESLRRLASGELTSVSQEKRYVRKDGTSVWVSVSMSRMEGDERHYVTVVQDIDARKRAEAAFAQAEERQRLALDAAELGTFHHDMDTGLIELDARALRHFDEPASPISFDELLSRLHPDDVWMVRDSARRLRETGRVSIEPRVVLPSARVQWLRVHMQGHFTGEDAGRRLGFAIATTRDITKEKADEEALRALAIDLERRVAERTAELARAARAKDDFLASMSHDLRTPLNGILGLSEVLTEDVYGALNPKQQGAVARIAECGRHLLSLINDILDVSKVEAGKLELQLSPVGLESVCDASLRLVQEPARRKQIEVTPAVRGELPRVLGDERRLVQVFVNLLTNAVKFTPEGGRVGIEAALDDLGSELRVTVWDTGIGIAPEDMPRLFQPFVQLDSRLSRGHSGSGLGLALVKRLVGLHDGRVSVESQVGQGTRFTVMLPVCRPPDAAPPVSLRGHEGATSAAEPVSSRRRLLLAEDEETNVATVYDFLQMHGYDVFVASDGREAVAKAHELRPQVILMDAQMPVLDGLAATRSIRASLEVGGTPIVALTALAMPGDEDRCLAAGADAYLTKPVSLKRLLAVLDELCTAERRG